MRKTRDEFEVQGLYGRSYEVVTTEDKFTEARKRLKEYRENEKQTSFRIIKRRVKIQAA